MDTLFKVLFVVLPNFSGRIWIPPPQNSLSLKVKNESKHFLISSTEVKLSLAK